MLGTKFDRCGNSGLELEYKVRMGTDATLVYSWEVVDPKEKDSVHIDFHGHTTPDPASGKTMDVATWKQAYGNSGQGGLTAPFDGIQGWQFSNSSDSDIVVRVKPDAWRATAQVCRHKLDCDYLSFVAGIDWMPAPVIAGHDDTSLAPSF